MIRTYEKNSLLQNRLKRLARGGCPRANIHLAKLILYYTLSMWDFRTNKFLEILKNALGPKIEAKVKINKCPSNDLDLISCFYGK